MTTNTKITTVPRHDGTVNDAADLYIWTRDEAGVASRPTNDALYAMLSARIMRNT
jgi:hypothetical protein